MIGFGGWFEVVLEGSYDGYYWMEIEFMYKFGNLSWLFLVVVFY